MTEWKPIVGYEGRYEVSSDGQVRSLPRMQTNRGGSLSHNGGRVMKGRLNSSGYFIVGLYSGGKKCKDNYVHRLVAVAFLEDRQGTEVNHKNLDKTDNRVENLEWCSRQDNVNHAVAGGRYYGHTNPNMAKKLTTDHVDDIRARAAAGELQRDIADDHGIHKSLVSKIHLRLTWASYESSRGNA